MANKANSLAHTKWLCKYHIVFTPKYRRKIIYSQYKESVRDIIKQLCAFIKVKMQPLQACLRAVFFALYSAALHRQMKSGTITDSVTVGKGFAHFCKEKAGRHYEKDEDYLYHRSGQ